MQIMFDRPPPFSHQSDGSSSVPIAILCRALVFVLLILFVGPSDIAVFAQNQNRSAAVPKKAEGKEPSEKIEAFLEDLVTSSGARWFRYFHVPPKGDGKEQKSLNPSITLKAYMEKGQRGEPSPQEVFNEFWEKVVKPAAEKKEHGVVIRDAIHDPEGEWGRKLIDATIRTLDPNGDNSPKAIKALIKDGKVSKEHAALMWFARDLLVRRAMEPVIAKLKQMHPGLTFKINILDSGSFGSISSDIDKTLPLTVWKDGRIVDDPFGSEVVMGGDIHRFIQLVYDEFDRLGKQLGARHSIFKSMDTEFFPSDTLPQRFARASTYADSDTPVNRSAAMLRRHFDALQRNPGPSYQFNGTVIAQVTGRTVEQDANLKSQIEALRDRRDLIYELSLPEKEALLLEEALTSTHSPAVEVEEVDGKVIIRAIDVVEFLEKNNLTVRYEEWQAAENAVGNLEKLLHKHHYIIDAEGGFHEDKYDTYFNDLCKYGDRPKKDFATSDIPDDDPDKPKAFGEFDRRFGPSKATIQKYQLGDEPPNSREYTEAIHRQIYEPALKKLYAMTPDSPDAGRSVDADLKLYWATNLVDEMGLAVKADPGLPAKWGYPEGEFPFDKILQPIIEWIQEHEPERFGDIAHLSSDEQQKAKITAAKRLHVEAEDRASIVLTAGNLQKATDMWLKQGDADVDKVTRREKKKVEDLEQQIRKLKSERSLDNSMEEKVRQMHLEELEARLERANEVVKLLTKSPEDAEAYVRMLGEETCRRLFMIFKREGGGEAYDRMISLLPEEHQKALNQMNRVWEALATEKEKRRIAAENRIDLRRIALYGKDVARRLGWSYAEQFGIDTEALSYVPKHPEIYDNPNHPYRVLGRFLKDNYMNIGTVDSGLNMVRTMQLTEGMPYEQRMRILAEAATGEFISGIPAAGPVWATYQGYRQGDPKMMAGGVVNGASELSRMWFGMAAESLDDALIQAGQVGRVQALNRIAGLGHTASLWLGLARTAIEIVGHEAFAPVNDHFFQLVYKGYVDEQKRGFIRAGTHEVNTRIPVTPIIEPQRGRFWFLYLKPNAAQWYLEDLWAKGEQDAVVALLQLAGLDENLDKQIKIPVMIDLATDYGKMADAAERQDLQTSMLSPKLADKAELARRNVVSVYRKAEILRQATWKRIEADRDPRNNNPSKPNFWMLAARENLGLYLDEQFQSQEELLYQSLWGMTEAKEKLKEEADRTWEHWQATAPSHESLSLIRKGFLDVMSPLKNYEARLAELKKAADEADDIEWSVPQAMFNEWMARSIRNWMEMENEEDLKRRQKTEYLQRQIASLGVFIDNDYMNSRTPTQPFRLEEAAEWYGSKIREQQRTIRELPGKRVEPGSPKKSEQLMKARRKIAELQSEYSLLMEAFSQADQIVAPKIAQLHLMHWLAGEVPFDNDVHLALKFIWQDADTQQRIRRKVTEDLVRGRRLIPKYRNQVQAMASLLDAEMGEIAVEYARLTQDKIQQAHREALALAEAMADAREKPDQYGGKLQLKVEPYLELTDEGIRVHVDTRADHDIYRAIDVAVKNSVKIVPHDKIASVVGREVYDHALKVSGLEEEEVLFVVRIDSKVVSATPPRGHEDKPYPNQEFPESNGHLLLVPGMTVDEIISVAEAKVFPCVISENAPEDLPARDALDYCDPSATPMYAYDRIAVFFTPRRDLKTGAAEPAEETEGTGKHYDEERVRSGPSVDGFYWELLNPEGTPVYQAIWTPDNQEQEETGPHAPPDSPGEFVFIPDLWGPLRPGNVLTPPGTYTLRTSGVVMEETEILGGGSGQYLSDEYWQIEGTFELADPTLHFQGFVTEPTKPHSFSMASISGNMEPSPPRIQGSTVTLDLNAAWKLGQELQEAKSRLILKFPDTIDPGLSDLFDVKGSLQMIQSGRTSTNAGRGFDPLTFVAGLHLIVPTNRLPPDRYLIRGDDRPKPLALSYRFTPASRETWVRFNGKKKAMSKVRSSYESTATFVRGIGHKTESIGLPHRKLPWHLRDEQTIWVIPAFSQLVKPGVYDSQLAPGSTSFYGYAIYGPGQEQYAGPNPAGDPVEMAQDLESTPEPELPEEGKTTGQDQVPELGGKQVGDAATALKEQGLNPQIVAGPPAERHDQAGKVASVSPPPGTPVRPGQDVTITVYTNPIAMVTVPALKGTRLANVATRLDAEGLRMETPHIGEPAPAAQLAGTVYQQDPQPGIEVERDSPVHVWVYSEFVRLAKVPLLTGRLLSDAENQLKAEGLQMAPRVGEAAPESGRAGRIYKQDPAPSMDVAIGTQVRVWVHADFVPALVSVPDLRGTSSAEAARRIQNAGLVLKEMPGDVAPDRGHAQTVQRQDPRAYSEVKPGSEVRAWVYSAPMVTVPNLQGLPRAEAESRLRQSGLVLRDRPGNSAPERKLAGRVQRQDPPPFAKVELGSTVTAWVYSDYRPTRVEVPDVSRMRLEEARRRVEYSGLVLKPLRGPAATSASRSQTVQRQSPLPRTRVQEGSIVTVWIFGDYIPPVTPSRPRTESTSPGKEPRGGGSVSLTQGRRRDGTRIQKPTIIATAQQCRIACEQDERCVSFSWEQYSEGAWCTLFTDAPPDLSCTWATSRCATGVKQTGSGQNTTSGSSRTTNASRNSYLGNWTYEYYDPVKKRWVTKSTIDFSRTGSIQVTAGATTYVGRFDGRKFSGLWMSKASSGFYVCREPRNGYYGWGKFVWEVVDYVPQRYSNAKRGTKFAKGYWNYCGLEGDQGKGPRWWWGPYEMILIHTK